MTITAKRMTGGQMVYQEEVIWGVLGSPLKKISRPIRFKFLKESSKSPVLKRRSVQ